MTIGNLSTDIFAPRTSTGSCIFPSLDGFDAIVFVTSNRRHKNKSFPVHGKEQNHAKKKTFDFRLPSVALKRLCLSSLIRRLILHIPKKRNENEFLLNFTSFLITIRKSLVLQPIFLVCTVRFLLIKSYLVRTLDVDFLSSLRCQIANETASKRKSLGLKFLICSPK